MELDGYSRDAIRKGSMKLIENRRSGGRIEPARELFDLRADPRETNNLSGRGHPAEAGLVAALAQWRGTVGGLSRDTTTVGLSEVDERTLESLRSLGYIRRSERAYASNTEAREQGLPPGRVLRFGVGESAEAYLGAGWGAGNPGGWRWTVGDEAELSLPVEAEGPLTLDMEVMAFTEAGRLDRQRITVLANGLVVAEWMVDEIAFHERSLDIPVDTLRDSDQLVLTFLLPDTTSPASLDVNTDSRELGLAFRWLRIHPPSSN